MKDKKIHDHPIHGKIFPMIYTFDTGTSPRFIGVRGFIPQGLSSKRACM